MQGLNSILLALAAIVVASEAATVNIKAVAPYSFTPNITSASPGDVVMWTTGGTHSVIESDAAKSCNASTKANAFNSKGPISTTSGFSWTVPNDAVVGSKVWYYCGVPTHCQNGMTGTINIVVSSNTSPTDSSSIPTDSSSSPTDISSIPTDISSIPTDSSNSPTNSSSGGNSTPGGSGTSNSPISNVPSSDTHWPESAIIVVVISTATTACAISLVIYLIFRAQRPQTSTDNTIVTSYDNLAQRVNL